MSLYNVVTLLHCIALSVISFDIFTLDILWNAMRCSVSCSVVWYVMWCDVLYDVFVSYCVLYECYTIWCMMLRCRDISSHPILTHSSVIWSIYSRLVSLLLILDIHLFFLCYVQLISLMCSFSSDEKTRNTAWKVHGWASIIAKQAYSLMLPAGLFLHKKCLLVREYTTICLCSTHSISYSSPNSNSSFFFSSCVMRRIIISMNADQWSW